MTTTWEQAKSGVRLASTVVGGFLVFLLLLKGLLLVRSGTLKATIIGAVVVLAVCSFLFVTSAHWAKWFAPAFGLWTLRAILMGILGRTISVPSIVAPRLFFVGIAAICTIAVLLSYRFVDQEPNRLDSLCLVAGVLAFSSALTSKEQIRDLVLVDAALIPAFVYDRFVKKRKKRKLTGGV